MSSLRAALFLALLTSFTATSGFARANGPFAWDRATDRVAGQHSGREEGDARAAASVRPEGAQTLTGDALLELFVRRLSAAPPGGDVTALEAELARLEASRLPRLRVGQRATWDYQQLVTLGLHGSLGLPLGDPVSGARRSLVAQRLALARHNEAVERAALRREFAKTVRLLAHLSEAEALLARHRRQLLALRPQWIGLEEALGQSGDVPAAELGRPSAAHATGAKGDPMAPGGSSSAARGVRLPPRLEPSQIGYLEVVQALRRTRRERSLLMMMVAERVGLREPDLLAAPVARPSVPAAGDLQAACLLGEGSENDQVARAGLVLEEARLAEKLEAARALPQFNLDLSGDARYSRSGSGSPWNGGLRLTLRVSLPAAEGVNSEMALSLTPAGASQELDLSWPAAGAASSDGGEAAERAHREAVERSRLDALRTLKALEDARDRLRLRRAELALIWSGGPLEEVADLDAAAQARLAVLNAELEVDLASIEVAAICRDG